MNVLLRKMSELQNKTEEKKCLLHFWRLALHGKF